jgi:polygalacturonase
MWQDASAGDEGWEAATAIREQTVIPVFPPREYRITDFGADAGGGECRAAITSAVMRSCADGGGTVVVPPGEWFSSGPLHLKSNVHLHISKGATLRFSGEPDHYLPPVLTRWEGTDLYNYSPLLYACLATNVAVTGEGVLEGNGRQEFGTWKPRQAEAQRRLRTMGHDGVPVQDRVFGKGSWLRPPMLQFYGCKNVLIEGISLHDSPFWCIHPVYCYNVTVRNVTVESGNLNNDGIDPDSSVNVVIERCRFATEDDAIAIKSGRDQDGWRGGQPSENIVIRDCDIRSKVGAVSIGSEMSGGIRNVFVEECRVGKVGALLYVKANLDRGGVVERVRVRDVAVDEAETVLRFTTAYHGYRGNRHPPVFRDFAVIRVRCARAATGIDAVGIPEAPLRNILVRDMVVDSADRPLHADHVDNLLLEDVRVNGAAVTWPQE